MSWTVACFCGTVFQTPPDRCPACSTPLPDVSGNPAIDSASQPLAATIDTAQVLELLGSLGKRPRAQTRNRRR
jgi:hypothetical protein